MNKTFEEFLEDRCNSHTNNSPEGFERWLEQLDVQEVIDYAERWMKNYKIELLPRIAENLIKYAEPKAQYDGLFASKLAELILGEDKKIMQGADENDILKEYKERE